MPLVEFIVKRRRWIVINNHARVEFASKEQQWSEIVYKGYGLYRRLKEDFSEDTPFELTSEKDVKV